MVSTTLMAARASSPPWDMRSKSGWTSSDGRPSPLITTSAGPKLRAARRTAPTFRGPAGRQRMMRFTGQRLLAQGQRA